MTAKTMAEVLRETMRDHCVLWEIGLNEDSDLVAKCESCGYLSSELDTWEHQSNVAAEILSAAGFGLVADAKAEAWAEGWAARAWRDPVYRVPDTNPYRATP